MFFTNTKTTKFISFPFDFFFPQEEGNKMSSEIGVLDTHECPWLGYQGVGSEDLQCSPKCTIVSLQCVAALPSLQCGGREWNKGRRDVECAFLPTVRIWS